MIRWTKISEPDRAEYEAGYLEGEIERMEWLYIPHDGTKFEMPFVQGMAINEAIRQLRIPYVEAVALNAVPVIGIRARYGGKLQPVNIYLLDNIERGETVVLGTEII